MKKSYTIKDIPNGGFWKQVKVLAATKSITIKQLIINLLKREIKKSRRGDLD